MHVWLWLTSDWCTVHDLELRDRLALVVLVWWRARSLATDNRKLHMLDLDADEQEVDLADDDVFQVVSAGNDIW